MLCPAKSSSRLLSCEGGGGGGEVRQTIEEAGALEAAQGLARQ